MPSTIRILDRALCDQIAAGEVVERPASVVKELLDNSIDAGARRITVDVEDAGLGLIRVADDGHGMSAQDAALSIRRHATSKIERFEDLCRLQTLGFRGEALPSIASVSKFTLTTRTEDALAATRVVVEGGAEPTALDAGGAAGTVVEVRDLFYNVPARRKFLRSETAESARIADVCMRTALAMPSLYLTLVRNGRRAREFLPAQSVFDRARLAFERTPLTEMTDERDGIRVTALLSAPERARNGATGLYLYVNGRPVRDAALARAVAFAYGSVLAPGRYPYGVVLLTVPPERVDVNVHPQKSEVRFADPATIFDTVTRLLARKLGGVASGASGPATRGRGYWTGRLLGTGNSFAAGLGSDSSPDGWGLLARDAATAPIPPESGDASDAAPSFELRPNAIESASFGMLRVLGQVRKLFIVCEDSEGLLVFDQHAVDERRKYDALRQAHASRAVAMQALLFPERVEVSDEEAAFLDSQADALLSLGLDCARIGARTIAIRAVPQIVSQASPETLLRDALGELSRAGERALGDRIDTVFATMACHAAIRAGDELSPKECAELVRGLDDVHAFRAHCPHGRPVVHRLSFAELETKLGR